MKNSQYVRDNAFVSDTRHGNLFTDGNGTMFSYGYHYPLLFKVNGLKFVNTNGYSSTTAKHIYLANPLADFEVKIPHFDSRIDGLSVQKALVGERVSLLETLKSLKRHDTIRERNLLQELAKVENTITELQKTM